MHAVRMEMLERFRCQYQALVASDEEMGMKRARADGRLSLLLQEVSEVLPVEQKQVLEEILALHESLWSSSPAPRGQREVEDLDRKSTRLNSSHANISYAVFC